MKFGARYSLLKMTLCNDLALHIPEATVVQYADDVQILVKGRKQQITELISSLERHLSVLADWFSTYGMKVNPTKTQLMVHGTRSALRDLPSVQIRFGNSMISESLTVKNLGVTMDRFLSFEPHINQLVAKCTGVLVSLIHSKHVLPSYTVAHVVNALVVSSIRYCISIYGTCGKTQLHRVQKLLNFCARVISGRRKFQHVADVLQQLQWLRAEQLVNYHRLCLAKNSLDTGLPADIAAMFTFAVTPYNTRQTGLLSHPRAKTCSGQRRLSHCSQQFNQLPPVMKGLTRHTFNPRPTGVFL